MTERVDIVNQALTWLGADPITSLEDDVDRALQMKINYIPTRDAALEAHEWSFAIMRFIPAQNETAPVYGAGFAYDVPPQILRVIAVESNTNLAGDSSTTTGNVPLSAPINSHEQLDWVMERNQIICNEAAIYCRGIRRVEEEGRFSPLFVQAFAAKLAYLTAVSITASAKIQENMFLLYDKILKEAKTRDGIQGRSRRIRGRSLRKAR